MAGIQGIDEMSALGFEFEAAAEGLTRQEAEPVLAMIAAGYRRRRGSIPRDTGALMRSLTARGDRAHVEGVVGDRIFYGSNLPQAQYQAHRIPEPFPDPIVRALASALWRKATGV